MNEKRILESRPIMKILKKHMKLRIMIIILIVLALPIAGVFFMSWRTAKSTGAGSGGVADFDKKVVIWEKPAGSSENSKLDDMCINYHSNRIFSILRFIQAIVGADYSDKEKIIDTFTYQYEIKSGFESKSYDDQPYIIPYLSSESDRAVIVIPGGGFGYKSMDGSTGEGRDVAVTLQENGINAFVLHYRSNPYEYPVPFLDVQRAVRFLKYNASEYGIDPDKIGLIGFSAGGNEIGGYIGLVMGNDLFPESYQLDEIDQIDDSITAAAMIYPALTFDYNVPMLFSLFDADEVRDADTREELLDLVDLKQHINRNIPQFIAYGTKDGMVNPQGTKEYIEAAQNQGVDVSVKIAEGQDHGFSQEYYMDAYLNWLDEVMPAEK